MSACLSLCASSATEPEEPRRPGLAKVAPDRLSHRDEARSVVLEWMRRRSVSKSTLALMAQTARPTLERTLDGSAPLWVETILSLPDADALDVLDALRDIVRARRNSR